MDDYLEARAAKVETADGDADTTISFNCLKADFPDVLEIFVDLLRHPAFREDKLALAKKQMNSGISRRNDESEDIASMQTDILGYGKNSAYALVPEYATVAAVTREDLLQWHRQHTTPELTSSSAWSATSTPPRWRQPCAKPLPAGPAAKRSPRQRSPSRPQSRASTWPTKVT